MGLEAILPTSLCAAPPHPALPPFSLLHPIPTPPHLPFPPVLSTPSSATGHQGVPFSGSGGVVPQLPFRTLHAVCLEVLHSSSPPPMLKLTLSPCAPCLPRSPPSPWYRSSERFTQCSPIVWNALMTCSEGRGRRQRAHGDSVSGRVGREDEECNTSRPTARSVLKGRWGTAAPSRGAVPTLPSGCPSLPLHLIPYLTHDSLCSPIPSPLVQVIRAFHAVGLEVLLGVEFCSTAEADDADAQGGLQVGGWVWRGQGRQKGMQEGTQQG